MSKKQDYVRLAKRAGIKSPQIEYNRALKVYSVAIGNVRNPNGIGYTDVAVATYSSLKDAENSLKEDIQSIVNDLSGYYPDIVNRVDSRFASKSSRSSSKDTYSLGGIISKLGTYDFDTLRDMRDLLEYQQFDDRIAESKDDKKALTRQRNQIKLRIRGRHSTQAGGGKTWDDIRYPSDLVGVVHKLPTNEREILLITVKQLIQAKRPKPALRTAPDGTPVARGTFQTKTKKNAFVVKNEDGTPARDKDGNKIYQDAHYLYFRLYTTNLDGTKRNASIYIGSQNRNQPKPFYQAVVDAIVAEENNEPIQDYMITADDLVSAFAEGGYEAIKQWRDSMDEGYD